MAQETTNLKEAAQQSLNQSLVPTTPQPEKKTPPALSNGPQNSEPAVTPYQGASLLKISVEEQKRLTADLPTDDINIRPDGLLYLPQVFYRVRLNQAFGVGQWALVMNAPLMKIGNVAVYDGSLYVRGMFVARAAGETQYHETNAYESWATACESAKSDCLVRCCKDIGIATELWMPRFHERWIKEHAVRVWRSKMKNKNGGVGGYAWRTKFAEPFPDETASPTTKKEEPPKEAVKQEKAPEEKVPEPVKLLSFEELGNLKPGIGKVKDTPFKEIPSETLLKAIKWAKKEKKVPDFVKNATRYLSYRALEESIQKVLTVDELLKISKELEDMKKAGEMDEITYKGFQTLAQLREGEMQAHAEEQKK